MANIGATTAFYKVETSLTRANNEVSKSMERLATGKQNANAGDRSSYAAMATYEDRFPAFAFALPVARRSMLLLTSLFARVKDVSTL